MDIGQPKDYLDGTKLYLQHLHEKQAIMLSEGPNIIGNVLIHESAKVEASAVLGPNVTIGENCVIGKGVRISDSIVLANSEV